MLMKLTVTALILGGAIAAMAGQAMAQRNLPSETVETSAGQVKITPIYHATAMIEGGGKVIYIDPAKPANFAGLPKADLILITHEHPDHVDQDLTSIKAISKPETKIWATEAVAKFVPNAMIFYNGEIKRLDRDGWMIEVVPAYNLTRGPAKGELYHPKGVGNGYILALGGKRIYFSGDTEATPEMRALKNIDLAVLCMNLPYTMTPEEAADAVRSFKPKQVMPYHYKGDPPTDLSKFGQRLAERGVTDIEIHRLDWYPTQ
jgi:L-ascorbate metabolism protein UlaG (beta-lactamase superfamily)